MRTVDCEACGARFAVPDELFTREVVGRTRRIVCKRCGESVLLDGAGTDDGEPPWVVSFGENDDRELGAAEIVDAIGAGKLSGGTLIWRAGMDDWVALRTIDEFAGSLSPRPACGTPASSPPPSPAPDGGPPDPDPDPDPDPNPDPDPDPDPGPDPAFAAAAAVAPESVRAAAVAAAASVAPPPMAPAGRPAAPSAGRAPGPRQPAPGPPRRVPGRQGGRGGDALHALFAVESMPPAAQLSDAEVMSVPPSKPVLGPGHRVVVPRAARLPRLTEAALLGLEEPTARPLAPPDAADLLVPTPEPEATALDIDVEVGDEEAPGDAGSEPAVEARPRPQRAKRLLPYVALGAAGLALAAAAVLLLGRAPVETSGAPSAARVDPIAALDNQTPAPSDESPAAASPRSESDDLDDASGARSGTAAPRHQGNPVAGGRAAPPATGTAPSRPTGAVLTGATAAAPGPAPPGPAPLEPKATAAPTAAEPTGAAFDKGAASAALSAAASNASGCRRGADPSGTATVMVTFAPSGRVTTANLSGPPFAGTSTGGCIASTMRQATVPPFGGGHVTVSKRVVIQ